MESTLRSLLLEPKKVTNLCKKILLGDIVDELRTKSTFDKNILDSYLDECIKSTKIKMDKPNRKQFEAMHTAFSKSFSLIQGPPGTKLTKSCNLFIYKI